MDEKALQILNEALTEVMNRFRNFFIGPGVNMREEAVPFRQREEFVAPLVTVLGHTYGVRLLTAENPESPPIVEVSVNVYSDEFQPARFKQRLVEEYRPERVAQTIQNFMTVRDEAYIKKSKDPLVFASFFELDFDRDLRIVRKEKKTASKVTGKMVDTILQVHYHIRPEALRLFMEDPKLFASAVYLYCLRVFTLAYRKSLTLADRRLLSR
ncbi:MAG: hypothetical protein NZ742_11720 [Acidobacteria bacterium]|nr:hypothetical protein [Acidobacteriota bacterium]MDW7985351.1 hypothetical protein [Acidobacteriota bacterium]